MRGMVVSGEGIIIYPRRIHIAVTVGLNLNRDKDFWYLSIHGYIKKVLHSQKYKTAKTNINAKIQM